MKKEIVKTFVKILFYDSIIVVLPYTFIIGIVYNKTKNETVTRM